MIGTIVPLVQVAGVRAFWRAWLGHFFFAAVGGALLGGLVGLIGSIIGAGWVGTAIVAVLMLIYALRELQVVSLPLINLPRAVPFEWRVRFGRERASWLYGFSLGSGFTARTPYASFHLMLLWLALSNNLAVAVTAGVVYGMSRAIAPLTIYLLWPDGNTRTDYLSPFARNPRVVHIINGAALAFLGTVFLIGLIRR